MIIAAKVLNSIPHVAEKDFSATFMLKNIDLFQIFLI